MRANRALRRAVGAVLRQLRDEAALSQEALGLESDLHRTYVGSLERGERNPSVESLARILGVFRVGWSEFGRRLDSRLR